MVGWGERVLGGCWGKRSIWCALVGTAMGENRGGAASERVRTGPASGDDSSLRVARLGPARDVKAFGV